MSKMRRNDLDISADLLRVANTGAKKTRLVYLGNLNFKIVKAYLKRLMDNGLLIKEGDRYFTTDIGREFLVTYQEIQTAFSTPAISAISA